MIRLVIPKVLKGAGAPVEGTVGTCASVFSVCVSVSEAELPELLLKLSKGKKFPYKVLPVIN